MRLQSLILKLSPALRLAAEHLPIRVFRWKHDLAIRQTPDAILNFWQSSGYTHLLYYRLGANFVRSSDVRYTVADWQSLDVLLSNLSPPMTDYGAAYTMYRLK